MFNFLSSLIPCSDYDCCRPDLRLTCACHALDLSRDKFYAKLNRTCMLYTRSDTSCQSRTAWAEQFNGVTSFLDASTVYGSNAQRASDLRGGRGRQQRSGGRLFTNQGRLGQFDLPSRQELGK